MNRRLPVVLSGLLAIMFLSPRSAWACAVCFSGEDANRIAYIATTAFLTFFPLLMIGFGVFMLRRHILRKTREFEEQETGYIAPSI